MEELQEQPQLLNVEQGAITKIKEILAEEDNPDLMLRMFVSGGGCSGMQYGFTLEETKNEDDFDIEVDGIHILVDAMSSQYVQGAQVDYVENLQVVNSVLKIQTHRRRVDVEVVLAYKRYVKSIIR